MTCATEQDHLVFLVDKCYVYARTEMSLEKRSVLWVVLTCCVDTRCVGRERPRVDTRSVFTVGSVTLGKDAALAEGQVHTESLG